MSAKQKKKRAAVGRLLSRALRAALAGLAALAAALACGYLIYYLHAELTALPTSTRAFADIACAAGIVSSVLLAVWYIKSLFSDDSQP